MIIPGGTTNMTSLDIGVHDKPVQALHRLRDYLLNLSTPKLAQRPVLCIEANLRHVLCGWAGGTRG